MPVPVVPGPPLQDGDRHVGDTGRIRSGTADADGRAPGSPVGRVVDTQDVREDQADGRWSGVDSPAVRDGRARGPRSEQCLDRECVCPVGESCVGGTCGSTRTVGRRVERALERRTRLRVAVLEGRRRRSDRVGGIGCDRRCRCRDREPKSCGCRWRVRSDLRFNREGMRRRPTKWCT